MVALNNTTSIASMLDALRKCVTFKRFIFFGFPIYLIVVEYLIRFAINHAPGRTEDVSVLSACNGICAAGLSLIAPVLIKKPMNNIDLRLQERVREEDAIIVSKKDEMLINTAIIALLVLPMLWGFVLWMAHQGEDAFKIPIPIDFLSEITVSIPLLIALLIYFIGMIFTEFKEWV